MTERERATEAPAPATPYETAAWLLAGIGLLLALTLHLVPALVAGLLVTVVLHRVTRWLAGPRMSHGRAKVLAATLVGGIAVGIVAAAVLLLVGFIRGHVGDVPALVQTVAEVLDETRQWLEARGGPPLIPDALSDAGSIERAVSDWLRAHAAELRRTGGAMGRGLLHAAFGIAIGLLAFFRHPASPSGPLGRALAARGRRLVEAFEAVVFAQVKISAVNTLLTAAYLLVVLPLVGVRLPLRGTLVALTFVTGLLPVVGNLISNSAIVIISLGVSGLVAVASLAFLVAVHKLEYLLNARIIAGHIEAAAWEILVALLVFEAAFGIPGVVVAPILYAYVKRELRDRGLV